jgi:hypothetical protein
LLGRPTKLSDSLSTSLTHVRLRHMYSLVTMISLGILTKRSIAGFLEETGLCRLFPARLARRAKRVAFNKPQYFCLFF